MLYHLWFVKYIALSRHRRATSPLDSENNGGSVTEVSNCLSFGKNLQPRPQKLGF